MKTTTNASPGWVEANFLPRRRPAPRVVVIGGIDRSDIVAAALADPVLAEAVVPHLEPTCAPPCDAVLWRFETPDGAALNHPGAFARLWHRAPYAATVRLVCYQPGSVAPDILDEGTLGTRCSRQVFRSALDRMAMRFVRDAALERGRGPSDTVAGAPRGVGGWLDYQRCKWRDRLTVEWWSLGETDVSLDALLAGGGPGPVRWHMTAAGDVYLADPFPWPGDGRILCEEMPVRGGVGRIVAIRPGSSERTVVLDDGAHHSYPCTIQDGDETYCVPEATERGCTRIYWLRPGGGLEIAASPAPHLRLADPTLFTHGGRWWLACTDLDIGSHDNLCLLHAPVIAGPWSAHDLWPVKIDIRSARPAGAVFKHQGRLFRPAQDCAATYGAGVAINEIRHLSESAFAETLVTVLRPDRAGPFPHGLHTLVHDGERFWIDGKRFVFDPGRLFRRGFGKAVRLFSRVEAG